MIETNKAALINRRSALVFGGSTLFLAGCQGAAPGMMGSLMGGSGAAADWGSLIKSLRDALDKVATQTEELIKIQLAYAEVFGLKDRAAKWKGEAIAAKNGRANLDLGAIKKASESQQKEVTKLLNKGFNLDAKGKQKIEAGMVRHKKAIENAWVGAAMVVKVVIDARSAKKPTFKDTENLKYMKEIVSDGPKAIKFVKTSKVTYEAYADVFAYKAKIKVPTPPKTAELAM
jgi:hypothetical protein